MADQFHFPSLGVFVFEHTPFDFAHRIWETEFAPCLVSSFEWIDRDTAVAAWLVDQPQPSSPSIQRIARNDTRGVITVVGLFDALEAQQQFPNWKTTYIHWTTKS